MRHKHRAPFFRDGDTAVAIKHPEYGYMRKMDAVELGNMGILRINHPEGADEDPKDLCKSAMKDESRAEINCTSISTRHPCIEETE